MNYRMLMNAGILLFVILTLQCNNATSPNNQINPNKDLIGAWSDIHTVIDTQYVIYRAIQDSIHYDSLYQPHPYYHIDTVADTSYHTIIYYKTYSITYDSIKITSGDNLIRPCPSGGCYTPTLTGTWLLNNDSLFIYPVFGIRPAFSTRYLITKHLPDSLIFSSSDGIDTCQKQ
ncbi:MAG: hypothetical protein ABSF80_05575 [Chitinispirillaceae bacterium]|jgi:hypothetical protein